MILKSLFSLLFLIFIIQCDHIEVDGAGTSKFFVINNGDRDIQINAWNYVDKYTVSQIVNISDTNLIDSTTGIGGWYSPNKTLDSIEIIKLDSNGANIENLNPSIFNDSNWMVLENSTYEMSYWYLQID